MFPWHLQFSWRDLSSFPFYCFPLFLCTDHWGRLSYLSLPFFGTLNTDRNIFPFLLCLLPLLFSAICKASSDNHFAFLHFFFLGMTLITASCTKSWTSVHKSLGTLWNQIPWIYLSISLHNHMGYNLGHTWRVKHFLTYFLQFKSEFCSKKFIIWATISSQSCFYWLYRTSPSLAAENIIIWFQYWPSGDAHV